MEILSIRCEEKIYEEFYKIIKQNPRGKRTDYILLEMIEAYKKERKEESQKAKAS